MRWEALSLGGQEPGLFRQPVTVDTPEFQGITFHEIRAKSIINKVPAASRVPFTWTINPYRGCSHACVYCFARSTHEYLDFDSGHDFDSQIIVKVNAPELVRRELAAPKWAGDPIAMGTNVDCYQRAEGRYRLMPGIIAALRDAANPFSILTKGSLILRDLPLLEEAAERTHVSAAVSVGFVDKELWRLMEPGTPGPHKRLEVCATLNEHGIGCSVLMGPIIPYLTDTPRALDAAVERIAAAGATSVSPIVLHLRPGAREWFFRWLGDHHPELTAPYERLYGRGAYTPKDYQRRISRKVAELAARHGIDGNRNVRDVPATPPPPAPEQLPLM
jgi:DNA repair photolyase